MTPPRPLVSNGGIPEQVVALLKQWLGAHVHQTSWDPHLWYLYVGTHHTYGHPFSWPHDRQPTLEEALMRVAEEHSS